MTVGIKFQAKLQFRRAHHGRKLLESPAGMPTLPAGRVPRLARLMALAIRFDGLIRAGTIADQADLARLGRVSRARITQVMNLLHLAPDVQEAILFLPLVQRGRERIHLRQLQPIAQVPNWSKQRQLWIALLSTLN